MPLKKYYLTVDLIIDQKPVTVSLANFDIMALQKYTSFCYGPKELLMCMPNDQDFSVRNFISSHLEKPISKENDPFSIRTSESKRSKKIKILYKNDLDILLAGKGALLSKVIKNYGLTIEDILSGNISEEQEQILKYMYDKFAGKSFSDAVFDVTKSKLNMDYTFDKRYITPNNKRWLFIALSRSCASALIEDAFKDDRKRLELSSFLKDKTGDLMPNANSDEINKLLKILDDRLVKRRASNYYIRKDIRKNLIEFRPKITDEPKKQVLNSVITEKEIINYNKQRKKTPELKKELELSENIEKLKLCLKTLYEKKENIEKYKLCLENMTDKCDFLGMILLTNKNLEYINNQILDIEKRLEQLEYELYCLENNDIFYSDAGFIVEKSKDM